jgi:hypothetical protein
MTETTTMPVTLTSNYRDVLQSDTLRVIDALLEEEYNLVEMLAFIDKHNELDFKYFFEDYKHWAGYHSPEIADFFVENFGFDSLLDFQDIYVGTFDHETALVDHHIEQEGFTCPGWLNIDYPGTLHWLLSREDYLVCESDGEKHYFANYDV